MTNNAIKRPTIKEVALRANVSTATVSRALSGSGYPVSESLRERVQRAADDLGYQPNKAAQLLRKRSADEIGIIIPSISNPFYLQAINGIDAVVSESGQALVLCNTEHRVDKEHDYLQMLYGRQTLGAIISSVDVSPKTINEYVRKGMKIVLLDQYIRGANCPVISSNMRDNGMLAVNYLLDLGHREIAFATTPLSRWTRREIYLGYKEALVAKGITPDDRYLFVGDPSNANYGGDIELNAGALAANTFLDTNCEATAIVCVNDMIAFGVINTFSLHGIRVPDDVSVMGFDDIPLARVYCPPLTTVRYPSEQVGRLAAMMLTDSITSNKELDPLGVQLAPNLIVRRSTSAREPSNTTT